MPMPLCRCHGVRGAAAATCRVVRNSLSQLPAPAPLPAAIRIHAQAHAAYVLHCSYSYTQRHMLPSSALPRGCSALSILDDMSAICNNRTGGRVAIPDGGEDRNRVLYTLGTICPIIEPRKGSHDDYISEKREGKAGHSNT